MKNTIFFLLFSITIFAQSELKVMSYNIRLGSANDGENSWDFRKEKVPELIGYYEPDFLGMQEVQKMQLDCLLENLSQYQFIGLPRENGEFAEYSCIFYNAEKFKVLEYKTFWLSETPNEMSKGWDAACHRIVTYGLFQDKKSKQKFWIANTHLDHIGMNAREESAKMLVQLVNKLKAKKDIPFILTGDFNAEPNDKIISILKDALVDSYTISNKKPYGPKGTWNGFKFKEVVEKRIDYIFYTKEKSLEVDSISIIDDFYDFKYPSDHLPVLVHFK